MVPVKIKFSNLVRSNSPLSKSRQLNTSGTDSLSNIIKYIPISNKREDQYPILKTLLKGSEGNQSNKLKVQIKNGSFQRDNSLGQQKTTHRSISSHKKKGIRRGMKKEGEGTIKNEGFNYQFGDYDDLNLVKIKKLQLHPANSLSSSSEIAGDHETAESPLQIRVKNVNEKRFFTATTNYFNNRQVFSPKNREFSNISQPSTAPAQQRSIVNNASSPHYKQFYQIYSQKSQDSEVELGQIQNESTSKKDYKDQIPIFIYKNVDKIQKKGDMLRYKSETPAIEQDKQRQNEMIINNLNIPTHSDNQLGNEVTSQTLEIKKKPELPMIIKIDLPQQQTLIKNLVQEQNNDGYQIKNQSLSQQTSPIGQNRKFKENLQDKNQLEKPTNQTRINGSNKRKSLVKLKKQIKYKQPTQQEQNNIQDQQLNTNENLLSGKNNIQLKKLLQLKTNKDLTHSARRSLLTQTAVTPSSNQDSQDKIQIKPSIQIQQEVLESLSQQLPIQQNRNIYQDLQKLQQISQNQLQINQVTNQNQNQSFKQQGQQQNQHQNLEKQNSKNNFQQTAPKNQQKQSMSPQHHQQQVLSQERKTTNEKQFSISNFTSSNMNYDIKNSQKIFYDLPPQYSNRIKFRKLTRIYYKPRNYFRGTNVAVIHFDGVLGIYDNPFFNYLQSSDPQLPQQNYYDEQLNQLDENSKYKFLPQQFRNNQDYNTQNDSQINFNKTDYPQVLGRSYFYQENKDIEFKEEDDDENDKTKFKKDQLHIIQNLKQSLKKISQWYFVILILPKKSSLWLEIRNYLIQQHYFCDGIYTYDNQIYDYTSYYKRNINNIFIKNPEFKIFQETTETQIKTSSKTDLIQGNKTLASNMYRPQTERAKQSTQKELNHSFSGQSNNGIKDIDSNNNSYQLNDQQSNLDLELLIDYNQILLDLKISQPKKILLIDTLPLSMRECYSKVEASTLQNQQKSEDFIHNIQLLKLKEQVWRGFSLKFPKIKCHKQALRVVYLPSLHYEQKKFSRSSISFQSVLLEEIAQEFQDDMSESRYITRNKQRWYYLNLSDIFTELENQKLKECFQKHMKTGQLDCFLKQPQASIYKQEIEQAITTEQTIKQKIHKHFQLNNKMIEFIQKEMEKQVQNVDSSQPQQQSQIQSSSNSSNGNNKKQTLGFQFYLNNLIDNLVSRNNKIIKQFSMSKDTIQSAQQVQKIYSTFYDKSSLCTSKQQSQDKIEKELDLYIARKYKSSILFYFSNLQSSLQIVLFFLFAFLI